MKSLNLLTLLIIFLSADTDTQEYNSCILKIHCIHDDEDLTKLKKAEYMKTMSCRIKRHIECINTEIKK
jgi:hypothetical protein